MSIEISKDTCVGCGQCAVVCPGSLIRQDTRGKAYIKHPENCWGCTACLKECVAGAICFYLSADIGGLGGELSVRWEAPLIHWTVKKPDGIKETITVDSRQSNHY